MAFFRPTRRGRRCVPPKPGLGVWVVAGCVAAGGAAGWCEHHEQRSQQQHQQEPCTCRPDTNTRTHTWDDAERQLWQPHARPRCCDAAVAAHGHLQAAAQRHTLCKQQQQHASMHVSTHCFPCLACLCVCSHGRLCKRVDTTNTDTNARGTRARARGTPIRGLMETPCAPSAWCSHTLCCRLVCCMTACPVT
jgi:hypothetical protein